MKFKASILNFLMLAALSFVPLHIAYSQTASILPPAKTTYLDKNGKPLAFGTVDFYVPGTTTPKTTWQDAGQTIPNTNPVVLDNAGRSIVLGDGSYRQIVKDKNGNVIWDQVTSSTGSGGGGGGIPTVGDGDPVGIIKPWAGFIAPYQYVFAYGQEFTRASYPEAFQALTSLQSASCTTGSATLTGISDTSQLSIGSAIESACLNAGSTVVSKTVNTVVASSTAIISTTTSVRFFPYGNGNGTTTFNLPDLRGQVIAGRDNMGGIAASKLTSAYFGTSASAIGAKGGNESHQLIFSELPSSTLTVDIPAGQGSHTHSVSPSGALVGTTGKLVSLNDTSVLSGAAALTINAATLPAMTGTADLNGGNQAHTIVQPTQTLNYIIKVLPDTNPNTFFGVASIGGMYGVIQCGSGVTCSGNTISATSSIVLPTPTLTDLGGVYSSSCSTSNWFRTLDLTGAFGCSQPDFTDITGLALVPQGGTGRTTLSSNLPLIGNGTGPIQQGTVSGNTTKFATVSGTIPFGNCVTSDVDGNLIDFGTTCAGGGGTGSVVAFANRSTAIAATIPVSVNTVILNGYTTANDNGGGIYYRLSTTPSPVKAWQFQSADGAYWQLFANPILPKQVGAKLDGTADDTVAMQAWLDYGAAFGVVSGGQAGTAIVPTAVLNLTAGSTMDGYDKLAVKRTSNVVAALFQCDTQDNVTAKNVSLTTTAGFGSTSSVVINNGTKSFVVPSGLNLVNGNYLQIAAVADPGSNYMIGQILSYNNITGALSFQATTSIGSGTYANWYVDAYPQLGGLGDNNIAIRFKTCSQVTVDNIKVTGRFYVGIDARNGSYVTFRNSKVTGVVNRGINIATFGPAIHDVKTSGNVVDGAFFSNYCITNGASDGGLIDRLLVDKNQLSNCTGQGVVIGGDILRSSVLGNQIANVFNSTISGGITIEPVAGSPPPQYIIVGNNSIFGGKYAITAIDSLYTTIANNNITGPVTGVYVNGSSPLSSSYTTITGNTVQGGSGNAYHIAGSVASGANGVVFSGNQAIAMSGWGFYASNAVNVIFGGGNQAIANTAGAYSINGVTTTPTAANQ